MSQFPAKGQNDLKRVIVQALAITLGFVLPMRSFVSIESPHVSEAEEEGQCARGLTFKYFHSFDRSHSEAGFQPMSSHKMLRTRMSDIFCFPEDCHACKGAFNYYTLLLHPKICRIVCLVFVSAQAQLRN